MSICYMYNLKLNIFVLADMFAINQDSNHSSGG